MWNIRFLLILAGLTLCLTLPTPLNTGQDLLQPFNDLLPPLADNEINKATTETTNAPISAIKTTKKSLTTHKPPPLFKSTKKSYYQEQTEHIKELHLIDDDKLVPHDYREHAEHLQHLHAEQNNEYRQQQQKLLQKQKLQQSQDLKLLKEQQSVTREKTAATTTTNSVKVQPSSVGLRAVAQPSNHSASQYGVTGVTQKVFRPFVKQAIQKPKPISTRSQKSSSVQASKPLLVDKQVKHIPIRTHDDLKLKPSTPAVLQSAASQQSFFEPIVQQTQQPNQQNLQRFAALKEPSNAFKVERPSQHRFNVQQSYQTETYRLDLDALHQYVDNNQYTTHRPLKAGLPTLTPFPRHLK